HATGAVIFLDRAAGQNSDYDRGRLPTLGRIARRRARRKADGLDLRQQIPVIGRAGGPITAPAMCIVLSYQVCPTERAHRAAAGHPEQGDDLPSHPVSRAMELGYSVA